MIATNDLPRNGCSKVVTMIPTNVRCQYTLAADCKQSRITISHPQDTSRPVLVDPCHRKLTDSACRMYSRQARADSGGPFTPTTEADDFSGEVTAVHGAQAGRRDYVEGSDGSQITLGKPLALAERPRLDALGYSTGYPQTSVDPPSAAGDAEVESVAPVVAGERFEAYADSDVVAGAQIAQVGDEVGRAGSFVVRSESQSPKQEDAVVSRSRLKMDDAPESAPGDKAAVRRRSGNGSQTRGRRQYGTGCPGPGGATRQHQADQNGGNRQRG
jgi:hypothetical protein